jgi:hypothetical protein
MNHKLPNGGEELYYVWLAEHKGHGTYVPRLLVGTRSDLLRAISVAKRNKSDYVLQPLHFGRSVSWGDRDRKHVENYVSNCISDGWWSGKRKITLNNGLPSQGRLYIRLSKSCSNV